MRKNTSIHSLGSYNIRIKIALPCEKALIKLTIELNSLSAGTIDGSIVQCLIFYNL